MRSWVLEQLPERDRATVVIVDPSGVVSEPELRHRYGTDTAIAPITTWTSLRCEWEHNGRRRTPSESPFVFHIVTQEIRNVEDLPWDIETASRPARIRVPVVAEVEAAFLGLDDPLASDAITAIESQRTKPVLALLGAAAGRDVGEPLGGAKQFDVALRLRHRAHDPNVFALARSAFDDPLAQAVLHEPPRWTDIQAAWEDWLNEPNRSRWRHHVEEARGRLVDLFLEGVLLPTHHLPATGVPLWASVGIGEQTPEERVAALLDSIPNRPSGTLDEWGAVAQWWGEVRLRLAEHGKPDSELTESAWDQWRTLDEAFLKWLDDSYGAQLTRSWVNGPLSLDKVQPYLAYRRKPDERILLIVMDGMGFAQWAQIRPALDLPVVSTRPALAMLPTLTEVSRQAIAAGRLPLSFVDSISGTHREPHHWAAAWSDETSSASWLRIDGVRDEEYKAIPIGTADVIGVVLSFVDEQMHANELLGDIGLRTAIDAWLGSEMLNQLLQRAASAGYQIWMTADHGNLDCESSKSPSEGQFAERAGTRVRRYASKTLRDHSDVPGHRRDSLPGYPTELAERLLFAPGRTGWGKSRLAHGGLSFDEVIVPFIEFAT